MDSLKFYSKALAHRYILIFITFLESAFIIQRLTRLKTRLSLMFHEEFTCIGFYRVTIRSSPQGNWLSIKLARLAQAYLLKATNWYTYQELLIFGIQILRLYPYNYN